VYKYLEIISLLSMFRSYYINVINKILKRKTKNNFKRIILKYYKKLCTEMNKKVLLTLRRNNKNYYNS